MPKVIVSETYEKEIDMVSGEIISARREQKIVKTVIDKEPDFIKIYLNTIGFLHGLTKGEDSILFAICQRMNYATQGQEIVINQHIRESIAKEINCNEMSIKNAITTFLKKGLLLKIGNPKKRTACYAINPKYIARGNWQDIKKLQLTFDEHITQKQFEVKMIEDIEPINITQPKPKELPSSPPVDAIKDQISLIAPEEKYCSCGGRLSIIEGKYGKFWGCENFPKCKIKHPKIPKNKTAES